MDKKVYERNQKWLLKNPEKKKYYEYKSRSKSFIINLATEEDLKEIIDMCKQKIKEIKELKKQEKNKKE